VTSGSEDKIAQAVNMGARGGASYRKDDWDKELKKLTGGFDVIVDSSGGDTFAKLVDIAKPAGRIAMYGATLGAFNSGVPAKIFWKQLDILGSTMGNDEEFAEMVSFVNQHRIVPVVDRVFPMEEAQAALDRMKEGAQLGKIVLKIV
jgi:NADPH:quinone reductase-like Zn-dependent oxidoreductase